MEQVAVNFGGDGTVMAKAHGFKTGSVGYRAMGKVTLRDGKRYQVSVQMVEIGSKPKEEEA